MTDAVQVPVQPAPAQTVPVPSLIPASASDFLDRSFLTALLGSGGIAVFKDVPWYAMVTMGVVLCVFLIVHGQVTREKIRAGVPVKR